VSRSRSTQTTLHDGASFVGDPSHKFCGRPNFAHEPNPLAGQQFHRRDVTRGIPVWGNAQESTDRHFPTGDARAADDRFIGALLLSLLGPGR
jgi:hypothetical protein